MTLINKMDIKCSICGEKSSQQVLLSTNSMGTPDLDLRPPGMQRDTMSTWIQECPHCGYVSSMLNEESEIPREFLESDEYVTCDGFEFQGKLSERFFKGYLISRQSDNIGDCFSNLRNCAWDCDDRKDMQNARNVRKLAIEYLDRLIEKGGESKDDFILIKADFLRRSGEFSKLIEEYGDFAFGEEFLDRILTFHIIRAREGDDKRYTVADVE